MTDARRFQIEEIACAWQLLPVFLQDLEPGDVFESPSSRTCTWPGTLIGQWAEALEGEMNPVAWPRQHEPLRRLLSSCLM